MPSEDKVKEKKRFNSSPVCRIHFHDSLTGFPEKLKSEKVKARTDYGRNAIRVALVTPVVAFVAKLHTGVF